MCQLVEVEIGVDPCRKKEIGEGCAGLHMVAILVTPVTFDELVFRHITSRYIQRDYYG
jgi:hypothetical protein